MPLGGTLRSLCLIAATVLLGLSLQIYDGLYDPVALVLLIGSIVALALAWWVPDRSVSPRMLGGGLLIGNFIQLAAGFFRNAGATHSYMPPDSQGPYDAGLFAAALGLAGVSLRPRLAKFIGVYLLIVFGVIGVWKIRSAPHAFIDVYDFQTDGPNALLHGINPYSITFPNIYGPDTPVYGPGVVNDGRLMFGYPYAPLNLYWVTPAVALLGDFRYAQVLALMIAGLVLWQTVGGAAGVMTAGLLLFSPRIFYVIESGWTEPLSVMLLAVVAWSYLRGSRWMLVWFGLFVASKQYLPVTLFMLPLLLRRPTYALSSVLGGAGVERGQVMKAFTIVCAVGLGVSAPLVFWDFSAFWHSAITLQLHQPFRDDALSLLVPIFRNWSHRDATAAFAFIAAIAVGLAAIWANRPRSAFLWLALQLMLLFALNKQAFCNYYILVAGSILVALVHEISAHSRGTSTKTAS